jgi:hypothetical protein
MQPTLSLGQHVIVDEGAYDNSVPEIGDVILFHAPLRQRRFSPTRLHAGRRALTRSPVQAPRPTSSGSSPVKAMSSQSRAAS